MKRHWIKSSAIKTIGYDTRTQTLELRYHNGKLYRYFEVPPYHYDRLKEAGSVGRYISAHIKNYPFEEVDEET